MAHYQIGGVVQFVRKITRTDPDRVINIDEKAHIVDISSDGTYTVQLLVDEPPVAGILETDFEPSIEQPVDSVPGDNEAPDVTSAKR